MIVSVPVGILLIVFSIGCMVVTVFCVTNRSGLVAAKYDLQDEVRFLKVGNTFRDSELDAKQVTIEFIYKERDVANAALAKLQAAVNDLADSPG